ncbi:hypothetical protein ACHAWU_007412 [Discostella pseudostelligera]|uniref:Thioredoxin domain-containing protein n=1 Tax=Discostella pseudostelligera TaxID=259834 RepID=A0ABD3MF08_9STRA
MIGSSINGSSRAAGSRRRCASSTSVSAAAAVHNSTTTATTTSRFFLWTMMISLLGQASFAFRTEVLLDSAAPAATTATTSTTAAVRQRYRQYRNSLSPAPMMALIHPLNNYRRAVSASIIATSSSSAATSRSTTSLSLFSQGDFATASHERFGAPTTAAAAAAAAAARRRRHNHLTTFTPSSSSTTALQMVAKSGGKQILTTEQFEMEVLGINADSSSSQTTNSSNDPEEPNNTSLLQQQQQQQTMPILVLFTAPWCGPCRLTIPIVREIQNLYPPTQLSVYEISTDDLPEVAELAGVSSIPTIVLYYGGEVRDTIVGCVNVKVLSRAVEKVMEDVGMIK